MSVYHHYLQTTQTLRQRAARPTITSTSDLEVPDLWWSVDGSGNDVTSAVRQLHTVDADLLGCHQVGRGRSGDRPGVRHMLPLLLLLLLLLAGDHHALRLIAGHTAAATEHRQSAIRRCCRTACQLTLLYSQLLLLH